MYLFLVLVGLSRPVFVLFTIFIVYFSSFDLPATSVCGLILWPLSSRYTTLSYRAPEMINLYAGKAITTKADIWVSANFSFFSPSAYLWPSCTDVCLCYSVRPAEPVFPGGVLLHHFAPIGSSPHPSPTRSAVLPSSSPRRFWLHITKIHCWWCCN